MFMYRDRSISEPARQGGTKALPAAQLSDQRRADHQLQDRRNFTPVAGEQVVPPQWGRGDASADPSQLKSIASYVPAIKQPASVCSDGIVQLVRTRDGNNVLWNLNRNHISWGVNFSNNHIAASENAARNKATARALNHYRGHYTFMSTNDLKDAVIALVGPYGVGDHNVQLNNVDHWHITMMYGADSNEVSSAVQANGNVRIAFEVNADGYIRIFHMND